MNKNIPLFGFQGLVDPVYSTNYKDEEKVASYLFENTNTIVGNSGILFKRPGWTATHSLGKIYGKTVVKKLSNFQPYEASTVDVENDAIDEKVFITLDDLKEFAGYNRILPVKFPADLESASVRSYNPHPDFVAPTIYNTEHVQEEDRSEYLIDTGVSKHCIEHEDHNNRIKLGGINTGLKYTQPRFFKETITNIKHEEEPGEVVYSEIKPVVVSTLKTLEDLANEVLAKNREIPEFAEDTLYHAYETRYGKFEDLNQHADIYKVIKVDLESIGFKKHKGNVFKVFTGPDYEGQKYSDSSYEPSGDKAINNLYVLKKEGSGDDTMYQSFYQWGHYVYFAVVKTDKSSNHREILIYNKHATNSYPFLIESSRFSNIDFTIELYLIVEPRNFFDIINWDGTGTKPDPVFPDELLYVLNTAIDTPVEFPILAGDIGSDYDVYENTDTIKSLDVLPDFETVFMLDKAREKRSLFENYDEANPVWSAEKTAPPYKILANKIPSSDVVKSVHSGGTILFERLFPFQNYDAEVSVNVLRTVLRFYVKRDGVLLPAEEVASSTPHKTIRFTNYFADLGGGIELDFNTSPYDDRLGSYMLSNYENWFSRHIDASLYRSSEKKISYGLEGKKQLLTLDMVQNDAGRVNIEYASLNLTDHETQSRYWFPGTPFAPDDTINAYISDRIRSQLPNGKSGIKVFKLDEDKVFAGQSAEEKGTLHLGRSRTREVGLISYANGNFQLGLVGQTSTTSLLLRSINLLSISESSSYQGVYFILMYKVKGQTFYRTTDLIRTNASVKIEPDSLYLLAIPTVKDGVLATISVEIKVYYKNSAKKTISINPRVKASSVYYIANPSQLNSYHDITYDHSKTVPSSYFRAVPNDAVRAKYGDLVADNCPLVSGNPVFDPKVFAIGYVPQRVQTAASANWDDSTSEETKSLDLATAMAHCHYTYEDLEELKLLPLHSKAISDLFSSSGQLCSTYDRGSSYDSLNKYVPDKIVYFNPSQNLYLKYHDPIKNEDVKIPLQDLFESPRQARVSNIPGIDIRPFIGLFRRSKKADLLKKVGNHGTRFILENDWVGSDHIVTPDTYFGPRLAYSTGYSKRAADICNDVEDYDASEAYLGIMPLGYDDNGKPIYPEAIAITYQSSGYQAGSFVSSIHVIDVAEEPYYGRTDFLSGQEYDGAINVVSEIKRSLNSKYSVGNISNMEEAISSLSFDSRDSEYIDGWNSQTDVSNKIGFRVGDLIGQYGNLYSQQLGTRLDHKWNIQALDVASAGSSATDELKNYAKNYEMLQHVKAISLYDALSVYINSEGRAVHPLLRVAERGPNGVLTPVDYAGDTNYSIDDDSYNDSNLFSALRSAQNTGFWSFYMAGKQAEYNLVAEERSRADTSTSGNLYYKEMVEYVNPISYLFYKTSKNGTVAFTSGVESKFLTYCPYDIESRTISNISDGQQSGVLSALATVDSNTVMNYIGNEYNLFKPIYNAYLTEDVSDRTFELMSLIVFTLRNDQPKLQQLENKVILGLDLPNFDADYLPPITRTRRQVTSKELVVSQPSVSGSYVSDFLNEETGRRILYETTVTVKDKITPNPIDWALLGWETEGTGNDSQYVKYTKTTFARLQEDGADNSLWFQYDGHPRNLIDSFKDPHATHFKLSPEQLSGLAGNPFYDIDGQGNPPVVLKIKYDHDAVHEFLIRKSVIMQERDDADGSRDYDHYYSPYVKNDEFSIRTDDADGAWTYGDISRTKSLQMLLGDHQLGHFNRFEALAGAKWFNIGPWFNIDYNDYREISYRGINSFIPPLEADTTDSKYDRYSKVGTTAWQTIYGNEAVITLGKNPYKQITDFGGGFRRRRGLFAIADKNLPTLPFVKDGTNVDLTSDDYITQVRFKSNGKLSASPYFVDIGVVAILKLGRDSSAYTSTSTSYNVRTIRPIEWVVSPSSIDSAIGADDDKIIRVKALTVDEQLALPTDEDRTAYNDQVEIAHTGMTTRHDQPREIIEWLEDRINLGDGEAEVILQDNWTFFEVKFRRHMMSKGVTVTLTTGDEQKEYSVQPSVIDYDNSAIGFEETMRRHTETGADGSSEKTYSPSSTGIKIYKEVHDFLSTRGAQYAGMLGIGERPVTIHRATGDDVLGNLALSIPVDLVGLTAKSDELRLYQDLSQLITDIEAGTKTISENNPVKLTMTIHDSADVRLIGGDKKSFTQESLFILKEQEGCDLYLPSEERVISTTREEMFVNIDSLLGNFNIDTVSVGNSGDAIYLVDSNPIEGEFHISGIPGTGLNNYMQKLYYTAKLKTRDSSHLEFDAVPVKQKSKREVLRQNEIDFSSLPLLRSITDSDGYKMHESWNLSTNNAERQQTLNYLRDNMRLYEIDLSEVDNESVDINAAAREAMTHSHWAIEGANFAPSKWLKLKDGKFFLPKFRLVKTDKETKVKEVLQFEKGSASIGKGIENDSIYLILHIKRRFIPGWANFSKIARISNYTSDIRNSVDATISYPDYEYLLASTSEKNDEYLGYLLTARLGSITGRTGEDAEWFESNISSNCATDPTTYSVYIGFIPNVNGEFPEHVEAIYTEQGNDDPESIPVIGTVIKTIAPEFRIGDYMYSHVFYRNERLVLADTVDKPGYYNFSEFGKYDEFIPDAKGKLGKSAFEWHLPNKVWSGKIVLFNNDILTFYEKGIYRWEGSKLQIGAIETGIKELDTRDININVEPIIYGDEVFFIDSENSIRTLVKHPNIASGDYIVLKDKLEVPAQMEIKQLCVATIADTTVELVLTKDGDIYCHNKMCNQKQSVGFYSPPEGWSKWDTGSSNFPLGKILHIENVNSVVTAIAVDDENNGYILQLDENSSMDIPFGHKNITLKELQKRHNKFDEDSSQTERFIGRDLYYKSADGSLSGGIKEFFEDFDNDLRNNKEYGNIPGNKWFTTTKNVHRDSLDDDLCSIGFSIKVRVETAAIPQIKRSGFGNITNRQDMFSIENVHVGLTSKTVVDITIKEKSTTPTMVEDKYEGKITFISDGSGKLPFSGDNEVVKYVIGGEKYGDGIIIVECDSIEPFRLNSIVREISLDDSEG